MGNGQNSDRLQQLVADMVSLERQIEAAFIHWLPGVQEHPGPADAANRFQTMVRGQREALEGCLQRIGGAETSSAALFDITSFSGGRHAASGTLQAMTSAFNHAAFGYAMMHTVAHRFNDRTGDGNATDMAEQHQHSYFQASQEVYRLIPDVVISEMGESGECRCTCPSCSLGICLCWHAHIDSLTPISPADEGGIVVRLPKAHSAALQAGLDRGDVIIAVDGQKFQTYPELQAGVRKHGPGEVIKLLIQRRAGGVEEINITSPR